MADREFERDGDEVIVRTAPCLGCWKRSTLRIPYEGYKAWIVDGEYIQDALIDLTPAERELILTGIHDECWNELFPEEDE
jgi:hypothetical protein